MEDNDKNLEQFFNKKFAQNIDAESWNTPPEDVWIGIENDILRRNGRRKRFGLILPLLLGSLVLGCAGYFYLQLKSYETKLKELEIRLEACGSNVDQSISANSNVQPSQLEILSAAPPIVLDALKKDTRETTILQTMGIPPSVQLVSENNVLSQATTIDQQQSNLINESLRPKIPALKKIGFSPLIGHRPLIKLGIPVVRLVRYFDEHPINLNKRNDHNLFQIGIATEAFFWKDRINGKLDIPLSELLKNESVANTLSYGILAKKGISRHWSLDAGLFYGNRQTTSTYLLKIPYTIATEHNNPDGSIDNEFAHSLPSGLGNVNTVLVVNRSANSTVANNEDILLNFAYRLKTQSFFMPLKLNFYPRIVGKGFFGGFGINNQFDFGDNLKIVQAKSLHSSVHEKSIVVTFGNNRQRKYSLSGALNLGYQLPITNKISGLLMVGYNRALTNKFAVNGYSHKIDHWGMGVSLNHSF